MQVRVNRSIPNIDLAREDAARANGEVKTYYLSKEELERYRRETTYPTDRNGKRLKKPAGWKEA